MKCDLHIHSVHSDGKLTPGELLAHCRKSRLSAIAVTDHDSFDGSNEMQRLLQPGDPVLIPAVELSIRSSRMKSLHLLGYGFTPAEKLRSKVTELSHNRIERTQRMIDILATLRSERTGEYMKLTYDEVFSQSVGSVGRPHVARALVEHGYVADKIEAFARYIGNNGPAYTESEKLNMEEALSLMRESGFVPVLAHPSQLGQTDEALSALIDQWTDLGLMGIEVWHPSNLNRRGFAFYEQLARSRKLLVTGGSDFHEFPEAGIYDGKHAEPGSMSEYWTTAGEDVEALIRACRRQV